MAGSFTIEALLRPAVELYTVCVCAAAALLCIFAPWAFALTPLFGAVSAFGFLILGYVRLRQALVVLRYRRNIRRLPHYTMTSKDMPVSNERLFIGKGFRWTQKHTQRLMDTYLPKYAEYVEPTSIYSLARRIEERLEFAPFPLRLLTKATSWNVAINPVRPLPPVGGLPRLHGIEPHEIDVSLPLGERVRELTPAQKSMMLSARKESGKFTEGVVLSKSMEMLFRVVPPSLYLALAMTEPEEKKQRYDIMQAKGCNELNAAIEVAATLDRYRGIEPHIITFPEQVTALERHV
ncbi:hypothetical protein [Pseudomonas veronii]